MYATLWLLPKRGRRKMPFHIHVQNHIHYNLYFSDPFSFFFKAWWHKIWYFVKNKNWWWQPFYLGSVLPIILHYTFSLYMTFKATYNTCVKLLSHLHVSQLGEFQHSSCPLTSRLLQCFGCIFSTNILYIPFKSCIIEMHST